MFTKHYFHDLLLGSTNVCEQVFWSMKYVKLMIRLKITYSHQKSSLHVGTSSIMPDIGTTVCEKQHQVSL